MQFVVNIYNSFESLSVFENPDAQLVNYELFFYISFQCLILFYAFP
jgi:hypothetical protein